LGVIKAFLTNKQKTAITYKTKTEQKQHTIGTAEAAAPSTKFRYNWSVGQHNIHSLLRQSSLFMRKMQHRFKKHL